jgi:cell division transport system ATP-binding protein
MSIDTIINLHNLSVFQRDNLVLTNVNLDVKKGEFVFLTGRTASGKSSLLKILYADLEIKDKESIAEVAGYDLCTLRRKDIPYLRRKIGIVFLDFQLLPDRTVNDNLLFVLKATGWKEKTKRQERIQDVLRKVDLSTKGFKMPNQLSGGEQQRVVIARALLNDPDIILADEPTGNLDMESSEDIVRLLQNISKNGRAIIMATHDVQLLDNFPARIIKCEKGKLINTADDVINAETETIGEENDAFLQTNENQEENCSSENNSEDSV